MSERAKRISKLLVPALVSAGILAAALVLRTAPAAAHVVPSPCDFTTGGGWILIPSGTTTGTSGLAESGDKANFGIVGGCKNGGFYGHVNYVDHNNGLHVSSNIPILGYFCPGQPGGPGTPCSPNLRDICGTAKTNLLGPVFFRVRTIDAEKQATPPPKDKFGIKLIGRDPTTGASTGEVKYLVPTRCLANGSPTTCSAVPGGGDIELHRGNNSNVGPVPPPSEVAACGGDDSGLGN